MNKTAILNRKTHHQRHINHALLRERERKREIERERERERGGGERERELCDLYLVYPNVSE
jgi:hypothetical protein